MKSVSVILVITCLAGLFDFSTADSLETCSNDSDCYKWDDDYCIKNRCYSKVEHGLPCKQDRQCYESYEHCSAGSCQCTPPNKWLRTRCVGKDSCDYDSDCDEDHECGVTSCIRRYKFPMGIFIGCMVVGLVIYVIIIIVMVKLNRKGWRLMNSWFGNQTARVTTVVQTGPPQPVYQAQPTVTTDCHPCPPSYA